MSKRRHDLQKQEFPVDGGIKAGHDARFGKKAEIGVSSCYFTKVLQIERPIVKLG